MTAARDPGLQPQRTALAWHRTGLAAFVNALVVLRAGTHSGARGLVALGVLLMVLSAAAVVAGTWRARMLAASHAPGAPPQALMLASVGATWLACVAALLSIVVTLRG